jgi:hypothetical protein
MNRAQQSIAQHENLVQLPILVLRVTVALALLAAIIVEAGEGRMMGGDPCGRLPLLALLAAIIVEAGEGRMMGGDPCGRLPLFEMYWGQSRRPGIKRSLPQ